MSNKSSTLSRPQIATSNPEIASPSMPSTSFPRKTESVKCPYKADQQVKFLHLQAEVESLLLELQTIKQQRSSSCIAPIDPDFISNNSNYQTTDNLR
jgi:hypothetical protein